MSAVRPKLVLRLKPIVGPPSPGRRPPELRLKREPVLGPLFPKQWSAELKQVAAGRSVPTLTMLCKP
jgi:hypothetical protein